MKGCCPRSRYPRSPEKSGRLVELPGAPANLKVVGDITEENIAYQIDTARTESDQIGVGLSHMTP